MYAENLKQYPTHAPKDPNVQKKTVIDTVKLLALKQGKKAGISLAVLALSYVPYVGKFVLPAASFYTFNKAVGPQPAVAIFAGSLLLPRRYLVTFLQAYFSSRTLMRELVCCSLHTLIDGTDFCIARALLCTRSLQQGAEEAVVQGPCGCPFRLRARLLCLRQDPSCWCPDLWPSRGVDCLSDHQDH